MRASVSACTCIVLPDLSGSGQQIVWAVGAKLCAIGQRIAMPFEPALQLTANLAAFLTARATPVAAFASMDEFISQGLQAFSLLY